MDFDLTEDQRAIEDALDQIVERYRTMPVGTADYLKTNDALESDLQTSGFMDIARQEGLGALEAVLLVEAVGRIPYATEVAASALVAPQITDQKFPSPVVLARAPVREPLRFLQSGKSTVLIDDGESVRVLDVAKAKVKALPSVYNYPYGLLEGFDLKSAPVLKGADVEVFRHYWRLGLAAEIVGAMDAAIAMTVEYVKNRKQFGQPLGAFQAIQHRLSECAVALQAARMLVRSAAWSGDAEAAALAAAYAQDVAARVVYDCHQFHGAIGLTLEYPLHYYTYRLRKLIGELGGSHAQARVAASTRWRGNEPIGDPMDRPPGV